ncbi:rRNA pseudouridine synthase [Candidatus Woesearchaeota archaeon]|nr:rRNA pseudouridine synthase [Candidatus Woesearchaeota archaeon]
MSKKISLKQFLMKSGKFERAQDCEQAIRNGEVTVNSRKITSPNYFFKVKNPLVKFANEKLKAVEPLYFLLNKPSGYLSQKTENEKTIYDLLVKTGLDKNTVNSLFAVGRLDKDTEGLMIITNDGKLSDFLMNPKNEIIKKYYLILENRADKGKIIQLEKGIEIKADDIKFKTKPCRIKITGEKEAYISIIEGKKRQIRKMFEAIGNNVVYLKRVSIGGLQLGSLKTGEMRQLEREEIMEKLEF